MKRDKTIVKLKMKKIVFFNGTLQQGGAERVISILTKYMADNGYKVEIVLYYDREIFYNIHPNVRVISIEAETHTTSVFRNIRWLRNYFKNKADVIVSFLAPFNIYALIAHAGLRSKIIVADRNDPRFIPSNKIMRMVRDCLYKYADGVVCQTEQNLRYFSKGIQNKGIVIFNPIDLGEKRGLALHTEKSPKIVSVGRLTKQKNQKLAIDAFKVISMEFPEFSLVFLGDGDMKNDLQLYVNELSLSNRVLFPGSSKNVFDDESDAQLFLLTSDYEGMPNALIEAMCLGLPVISTKVSGATDLIQDGVNGFLLTERSVDELAEKMRTILSDDNSREKLGKKATELNDRLEVNTIMEQWVSFIDSKL